MKKLTLKMKLAGLCGLLLLFLAIVSVYDYFSLHRIEDLSTVAVDITQDNMFMLAKEIDHLKWVSQLEDLFLKEEVTTVTVQTDDHKCGLGKWLYGENVKKTVVGDQELAGLVEKIKEPHHKLHESAIKIKNTYVAFDPSLQTLLAQRWIDHLLWIKNLSNSLLTAQQFTGGLDPRACAFGKWYYGYSASDPQFGVLLREWEDPHTRLHKSARQVNAAIQSGDMETARNIYQEETLPTLGQLATSYENTKMWIEETVKKQHTAQQIFYSETLPAMAAVQQILATIRTKLDKKTADVNQQMHTGISTTITLVIIVSLAGIVLGIFLAVFIARSITRPVNRIIDGLNQGSSQVTAASDQVSSSSQMLAQGASEQASSLEESSASLEEISSMTKQNADHAGEARTMMGEVSQIVEKVNQHMGEMQTAIERITKSSEETGKIIKTIDEIAFQTNLLALNAAVEAARAGEAGQGFAVVAEEVRNLAQRSAEAAKNTTALIENTITAVQNGNDITQQTQAAFTENMEISKKVADLVQEIAEASSEQANGIEQVNKAVSEMDKVTQQNAASAEESASAAEELNAQAAHMKEIVNQLVQLIHGKGRGNGNTQLPSERESNTGPVLRAVNGKRLSGRSEKPQQPSQADTSKESAQKEITPEELIPFDDDFKDF